jgi:hypothetical protein
MTGAQRRQRSQEHRQISAAADKAAFRADCKKVS